VKQNPDSFTTYALSSSLQEQYQQDRANYQNSLKQLVKDAKAILRRKGQVSTVGGSRVWEYQSKDGIYTLRYRSDNKTCTVEKNGKLLVAQQSEKAEVGGQLPQKEDFERLSEAVNKLQHKRQAPSNSSRMQM
jgi:hypothetical protein